MTSGVAAVLLLQPGEGMPLGEVLQEKWWFLARQQAYNVAAAVAGVVLAFEYRSPPMLFRHFTWKHQLAFAAGCGHWLVCLFEELSEKGWLWQAYRLHHLASAGAFGLCLGTQSVSALGVAGLLFEVPVVLFNAREALKLREALRSYGVERLRMLWDAVLASALVVRGGLLLYYVHNLSRWHELWEQVQWPGLWHSIFALFAVLSTGWFCFLLEWRCQDLRAFKRGDEELDEGVREAPAGILASNAEEATILGSSFDKTEDRSAAISQAELRQHSSSESCWVAVQGHVYDVTSFLHEHPGGTAPILGVAGSDASVAFEKVGHSQSARRRLQDFAVASFQRPRAATESDAEEGARVRAPINALGRSTVFPYLSGKRLSGSRHCGELAWLLQRTASLCLCMLGLRLCPGTRSLSTVLLGVLPVGLCCGLVVARLARIGAARLGGEAPCCGTSQPLRSVALLLVITTVQLAPLEALSAGFAMALLLEACRAPAPRVALRVPVSWVLLSLYLIPGAGGCSWSESMVFCFALAGAVTVLCRAPLPQPVSSSATALAAAQVACWASLWAFGGWLALHNSSGSISSDVFGLITISNLVMLAVSTGCAGLGVVLLATLTELSALSAPRAAATWLALASGLLSAVPQLSSGLRCTAALGWFLQARHLVGVLDTSAHASGAAAHVQAFQFFMDVARGAVALGLWLALMLPVETLCSWVLPTGLRFYAFPSPLSDLEGRLRVGLCLMLEGEDAQPGHWVCNVGHIPGPDFKDMLVTAASSFDIMDELHRGAPGFVTNVLCVIPEVDPERCLCDFGWLSMREINLSVWRDAGAARAWYRGSQAHGDVLEKHRQGGLNSFGDMLATLAPSHLQWQRRCRICHGLAEGYEAAQCPNCPGQTYPIPRF